MLVEVSLGFSGITFEDFFLNSVVFN